VTPPGGSTGLTETLAVAEAALEWDPTDPDPDPERDACEVWEKIVLADVDAVAVVECEDDVVEVVVGPLKSEFELYGSYFERVLNKTKEDMWEETRTIFLLGIVESFHLQLYETRVEYEPNRVEIREGQERKCRESVRVVVVVGKGFPLGIKR